MENLDPPSPQIKDWKMARVCPSRGFILDLGGRGDGGLLFRFILSKIAILDKINGKPKPPSPANQDGKMARFCPSRGFILDLWEMGVCCSILFCPRL